MTVSVKDLKNLPEHAGVYFFKNTIGKIIYIGKAKNLQKRVSSYLYNYKFRSTKTEKLIKHIQKIEYILVSSDFEALLLEAKLIKKNQPKYNSIWKDDKHYLYLKITREEFPRLLLTRKENKEEGKFFGPFPSSAIVKEMYTYLRKISPFCIQDSRIHKPCFYSHIGLCNPCPASIRHKQGLEYTSVKKIYLKNIKSLERLLDGGYQNIFKDLKKEMRKYSLSENYEKAQMFKDRLTKIEYLISKHYDSNVYESDPGFLINRYKKAVDELITILNKYFKIQVRINILECYDVSNISGKFATGSMVTFVNGLPDKSKYKRFRIKIQNKSDDFNMLSEIFERRVLRKEWVYPDLFIVDGGKPQLQKILKILNRHELHIPLIGLAKKHEEIVIPKGRIFIKVRLPNNSNALHLLQRIRDESHRFAHKYHKLLQHKYFIQNI